jgi:hypothetical protein
VNRQLLATRPFVLLTKALVAFRYIQSLTIHLTIKVGSQGKRITIVPWHGLTYNYMLIYTLEKVALNNQARLYTRIYSRIVGVEVTALLGQVQL